MEELPIFHSLCQNNLAAVDASSILAKSPFSLFCYHSSRLFFYSPFCVFYSIPFTTHRLPNNRVMILRNKHNLLSSFSFVRFRSLSQ